MAEIKKRLPQTPDHKHEIEQSLAALRTCIDGVEQTVETIQKVSKNLKQMEIRIREDAARELRWWLIRTLFQTLLLLIQIQYT